MPRSGVKPLDKIAAKWARVAAGAQTEYEEGIKNPRRDWEASTKAAEKAYVQGVQSSIGKGLFGKGVSKAGTAKWQRMALAKGPARWSEGIGLAEDAYTKAFAPFHTALAAIDYPEKKARGDPGNIQRVAVVAQTLHALKLRLKGGV